VFALTQDPISRHMLQSRSKVRENARPAGESGKSVTAAAGYERKRTRVMGQ
jgi:hypothetical protein